MPDSPNESQESDEKWMKLALHFAQQSAEEGEVPVGAVLVKDGELIAAAGNRCIAGHDPTGHAEIRTLRQAAESVGNYRLPGSTLYVTLEPCTMCVGAIVHARVDRVVFGAREPKAGAVVSQNTLFDHPAMNTTVLVSEGVLETQCSQILSDFFEMRRQQKRLEKLNKHPILGKNL